MPAEISKMIDLVKIEKFPKGMRREKEYIFCEKCGERYGMINCRVTMADGRNICLHCGVLEEREHDKIKEVEDGAPARAKRLRRLFNCARS